MVLKLCSALLQMCYGPEIKHSIIASVSRTWNCSLHYCKCVMDLKLCTELLQVCHRPEIVPCLACKQLHIISAHTGCTFCHLLFCLLIFHSALYLIGTVILLIIIMRIEDFFCLIINWTLCIELQPIWLVVLLKLPINIFLYFFCPDSYLQVVNKVIHLKQNCAYKC